MLARALWATNCYQALAAVPLCVEGCRPPHFNLYFIIVTYMIIIIKAI